MNGLAIKETVTCAEKDCDNPYKEINEDNFQHSSTGNPFSVCKVCCRRKAAAALRDKRQTQNLKGVLKMSAGNFATEENEADAMTVEKFLLHIARLRAQTPRMCKELDVHKAYVMMLCGVSVHTFQGWVNNRFNPSTPIADQLQQKYLDTGLWQNASRRAYKMKVSYPLDLERLMSVLRPTLEKKNLTVREVPSEGDSAKVSSSKGIIAREMTYVLDNPKAYEALQSLRKISPGADLEDILWALRDYRAADK